MALLYHKSFDIPFADEGWTVTVSDSGGVSREIPPDNPAQGPVALKVTSGGAESGNHSYVSQSFSAATVSAGESLFLGLWINWATPSGSSQVVCLSLDGTSSLLLGYLKSTGLVQWRMFDDSGSFPTIGYVQTDPRWQYLGLELRRASASGVADGGAGIYINGLLMASNFSIANYSRLGSSLNMLRLGDTGYGNTGWIGCYDDLKIGRSPADIEPHLPPADTDTPCSQRTIILYRAGHADSTAFACSARESLGIPCANLCPLTGSDNEIEPSYAAFQASVENDLTAWLASRPTLAAQATTLLLGYGLPGGFTEAAVTCSATARLANLGQPFTGPVLNPFSQSAQRATRSTLPAGGYLVSRLDADTLTTAQSILNRGLNPLSIDQNETLFTDQANWAASLPAQRLRIERSPFTSRLEYSAAVFGTIDGVGLGSDGSKAIFVEPSDDSADSLRSFLASRVALGILGNGYASGMGFITSAGTECFDIETLFDRLAAGWTFVEAALAATSHLDGAAVTVGNPLMTLAFPQAGYNLYLGLGSIDAIDWSSPVAHTLPDATTLLAPLSLQPHQPYALGLRLQSAAGIEDRQTATVCVFSVDDDGNIEPNPLPRPFDLALLYRDGGAWLGFSWQQTVGQAMPTRFDILTDYGTGTFVTDPPLTVVTDPIEPGRDIIVPITLSAPARLAVRAATDTRTGPLSEPVDLTATATPASPVLFEA